jgi:hypothetical protein
LRTRQRRGRPCCGQRDCGYGQDDGDGRDHASPEPPTHATSVGASDPDCGSNRFRWQVSPLPPATNDRIPFRRPGPQIDDATPDFDLVRVTETTVHQHDSYSKSGLRPSVCFATSFAGPIIQSRSLAGPFRLIWTGRPFTAPPG